MSPRTRLLGVDHGKARIGLAVSDPDLVEATSLMADLTSAFVDTESRGHKFKHRHVANLTIKTEDMDKEVARDFVDFLPHGNDGHDDISRWLRHTHLHHTSYEVSFSC